MISNNVFQDNYHGLTINGSHVKVMNNIFRTSKPDKIPLDASIDNAIGILPFSSMFPPDNQQDLKFDCSKILIVANTIENIKINIRIADSTICRDIVIRENIIK